MLTVHNVVGTLVVLAFLVLTIGYLLIAAGRPNPAVRWLSMAAAALLLVQYVLGFSLLAEGFRGRGVHYVIALLALVTVGVEHGVARRQEEPRRRGTIGALAAAGTFVLVLAAHVIGSQP